MAAQRVGAVHVLGVDGRHHEGPGPRLRKLVPGGCVVVGLLRTAKARCERKRVGQRARQRGVAPGGLQRGQQAGGGAAGETALHHFHPAVHAQQRRAQALHGLVLQVDHAEVERDGIEPAREHDARTAGRRRALQTGNHLRHPARLAAQVHVVGAGLCTRVHQHLAVLLVRPDGGDHHSGLGHQLGECLRVVRVGHQQGQGGADAELIAHLGQPGLVAPGHGPGHAASHTAGVVQVLGHQPAGEAGGAKHDDVEGFVHAAWSQKRGCSCSPSGYARGHDVEPETAVHIFTKQVLVEI